MYIALQIFHAKKLVVPKMMSARNAAQGWREGGSNSSNIRVTDTQALLSETSFRIVFMLMRYWEVAQVRE